MVIAQFWAFANDLYTEEQGKRLFPLIGVGASLGAWVGAVRAGALVETQQPVAPARSAPCVVLVVCAALVPLINRLTTCGPSAVSRAAERAARHATAASR